MVIIDLDRAIDLRILSTSNVEKTVDYDVSLAFLSLTTHRYMVY